MKHSEKSIQRLILDKYTYHISFCNEGLSGWECDVLSLTSTDYLIDYEIKLTRADFKADFKKDTKHWYLTNPMEGEKYVTNRFNFVAPTGLLTYDDIPKYAGFIEASGGFLTVIKAAPLLHKRKVDIKDIRRLLYRAAYRNNYSTRKHIRE